MAQEKYIALSELKRFARTFFGDYVDKHPERISGVRDTLTNIVRFAENQFRGFNVIPLHPGDDVYLVEYSERNNEYRIRQEKVCSVEVFQGFVLIKDNDGVAYEYGVLAFADRTSAEEESVARNLKEKCWEEDNEL